MKFENHKNYNCKVSLDNGEEYLIYANWMHNKQLDNWKNWHCEAGATRIYVDKHLNVWSGECKNDNLGSVKDEWHLANDYTICKRERCTGCTDDLVIEKYKE